MFSKRTDNLSDGGREYCCHQNDFSKVIALHPSSESLKDVETRELHGLLDDISICPDHFVCRSLDPSSCCISAPHTPWP